MVFRSSAKISPILEIETGRDLKQTEEPGKSEGTPPVLLFKALPCRSPSVPVVMVVTGRDGS